jgi:hypothetical protein
MRIRCGQENEGGGFIQNPAFWVYFYCDEYDAERGVRDGDDDAVRTQIADPRARSNGTGNGNRRTVRWRNGTCGRYRMKTGKRSWQLMFLDEQ